MSMTAKRTGLTATAGAFALGSVLLPLSAGAQPKTGVGMGYQLSSPVFDDGLTGVEIRHWKNDRVGFAINGYYGGSEQEVSGGDIETSLARGAVQGMYSLVTRDHTRLYASLEVGAQRAEVDTPSGDEEDTGLTVFPAVGGELSPRNIPELALIWEVGYRYDDNGIDDDVDDGDQPEAETHGVAGRIGLTYYLP